MDRFGPKRLAFLIATLELGKAIALDALRGRPLREEDVEQIRAALTEVRELARDLNERKPWDLPSGLVNVDSTANGGSDVIIPRRN